MPFGIQPFASFEEFNDFFLTKQHQQLAYQVFLVWCALCWVGGAVYLSYRNAQPKSSRAKKKSAKKTVDEKQE